MMKFSGQERIRQLLVAAAINDFERVRYLLENHGMPVDSSLPGKPSALCYAAMTGNDLLTDYLIGRGADVNFSDGVGQTPLIYATLGGNVRIVHRLLQHGANLMHGNCAGKTALAYACQQGTLCCLNVLMEAMHKGRLLN